MNKALVFVLGMVAGAVLTVLVLMGIGASQSVPVGQTYFEEEGDVISRNSFKVIQVLDSGDALASEYESEIGGMEMPTGLIVLFTNSGGQSYYDDQVIELPEGACVRQIGTYKYHARNETDKTVPIVRICSE